MKFLLSTTSLALILCTALTPLSPALAETSDASQAPTTTTGTPEAEADESETIPDEESNEQDNTEDSAEKTPEETDPVPEADAGAEASAATSSTNSSSSQSETLNDVDDVAASTTQEDAASSTSAAKTQSSSDTSAQTAISTSTGNGSTTAQNDTYSDSDTTATNGNSSQSAEQATETASSSPSVVGTTSSTSISSSTIPSTTIRTGVSVATANIINLLNSNFINSEGAIVLLDILNEQNEVIDLRQAIRSGNIACSLTHCNTQGVVVQIENDATIDNTIVVSANSGENAISDTDSGAIVTGDAYANANIVNVANANMVNSRYLLAILNAFSNLNNDIVFPGLATYISQSTPSHIGTTNTAQVQNTIDTRATTGNNSISGQNGSITTGEATTGVNLFNQINSSLIGGDSVSIMLRVHGDWNGEVFGLPAGVEMIKTNGGYLLDFSGLLTPSAALDTHSSVNATNTARINNNLSVHANTGANQIGNSDTALISTGNAYAGASVINVANANVIGRNWMLGIINIYGDFTGNLAFGRPDIWVGGAVEIPADADNGDQVTYTYTVTNRGDSRARHVVLKDSISPYLTPNDTTLIADGSPQWQLGTLEAGETKTVSYTATIANAQARTAITNVVTVEEYETDNNLADNTEIVTFFTNPSSGSQLTRPKDKPTASAGNENHTSGSERSSSGNTSILDSLEVTRFPQRSFLDSSDSTSTQTIQLVNTSEKSIPGVIFTDTLRSQAGSLAQEEVWDLGTVLPHEEITLVYEFSFSQQAPAGVYVFSSYAKNRDGLLSMENNGSVTFSKTTPLTVSAPATEVPTNLPTATTDFAPAAAAVAGASTTASQKPSLFPTAEAAGSDTAHPTKNSGALLLLEIFVLVAFMYTVSRIFKRRSLLQ